MLVRNIATSVKKIFQILEWVFVVLVVLLLILTASSVLPTKKLLSSFVVASGSMEPAIPTGSVVFTTFVPSEDIQEQDVITFAHPADPKTTIVHRVISKNSGSLVSFITKGDNNNSPDDWMVTPDLLLGRMLFSIPYLGYLISFLKTPIGFALGIGVPSLILGILQIVRIFEGINDEVEKRTRKALAQHGISSDKTTLLLLIFLGSCLVTTPVAHGLFTATATVSGITLHTEAPPPTPDLRLLFYPYAGKQKVGFTLTQMTSYSEAEFRIEYVREGGIQEQIGGILHNDPRQDTLVSPPYYLGTCSGDVCTPHHGVEEVYLTITLRGENLPEENLQASLRLSQATAVLELPNECRLLTGLISRQLSSPWPNSALVGTNDNELIVGNAGNEAITALGGHDCIITHEGNHSVDAGDGNDIIVAGNGNDALVGGNGNDTFWAGDGNNSVVGGAGNDILWGGSGTDVLNGGPGNDFLDGLGGINVLDGGTDQDTCRNAITKSSCEL